MIAEPALAAAAGLTLRGELLACLGQAMQVPRADAFVDKLREWLPEDLADLCQALEASAVAAELPALRTALSELADRQALLAAYSALFLAPPPRVHLNLVRLLDGTPNGAGIAYLDEMLARHGVSLHEEHRELPDHITVVLELAGYLISRGEQGDAQAESDARLLVRQLLAPAAQHLTAKTAEIEAEYALPGVYSQLLALIAVSCNEGAEYLFPNSRVDSASGQRSSAPAGDTAMAACKRCEKPFVSLRDQALLIARLQEIGTPTDHLHMCSDCRDRPGG